MSWRFNYEPKYVVYLVCVPNTALIDAWYPVIARLKEMLVRLQVVVVFPQGHKMLRLRDNDAIARRAETIADGFVVPLLGGGLIECKSVSQLQAAFRDDKVLRKRALPTILSRRIVLGWLRFRRRDFARRGVPSIVCYSLRSRTKLPSRNFLDRFSFGPRFSVNHSLRLLTLEKYGWPSVAGSEDSRPNDAVRRPELWASSADRRVFVASPSEVPVYMQVFGCTREQVLVTGIPRLDPEAQRFLRAPSSQCLERRDAVLLISRRATSSNAMSETDDDWLPIGLKCRQAQIIHEYCRSEGLHLLIRPHPSENAAELASILPPEMDGISWSIIDEHASEVAPRLEFAVSSSSGLPVELIRLDIPTIEFRLGGRLETEERQRGLVLAADTEAEFRAVAGRVRKERDRIMSQLTAAFCEVYANPVGATERIAIELSEALAGPHVPVRDARAREVG